MREKPELSYDEKRHYLNILIENIVYPKVSLVSESTVKNKEEIINQIIEEFFQENKEEYQILDIKEIIVAIKKIKIEKYRIAHDEEER